MTGALRGMVSGVLDRLRIVESVPEHRDYCEFDCPDRGCRGFSASNGTGHCKTWERARHDLEA